MTVPARLILTQEVDAADTVSTADPETRPLFISLDEALSKPDAFKPPTAVLPRLAWRGYATALCASDKAGKSTLAGYGASEVSNGGVFLGERCEQGVVAWIGLEENVLFGAKRFHDMGADRSRVHLVTFSPPNLLAGIRLFLASQPVDLLVLDSLTEYARVITGNDPPGEGDTMGWSTVCRPLVQVARDFDVALLILHHVRRSDGQYRGSTEIAASVDVLWEMAKASDKEDPTVRHLKGRGRWDTPAFDVRYASSRYELAGAGELSTETLVLLCIERNPGASTRKIRDQVGGRGATVDGAIAKLEARGAIRNEGNNTGAKYFAGPSAQQVLT